MVGVSETGFSGSRRTGPSSGQGRRSLGNSIIRYQARAGDCLVLNPHGCGMIPALVESTGEPGEFSRIVGVITRRRGVIPFRCAAEA